jgi:HPt (histidine-containing phosphotransfer) domain-containing protein
MGLTNQNFQLLETVLKQKDYIKAFELCHSLKGVIGNLSLTPLYNLISELTEKLREHNKTSVISNTEESYMELYNQIITLQKKLLAL